MKSEPPETTSETEDETGSLPPEQRAIRAKCFHPSRSFVPFAREETEQSIPQRFEAMAKRYPERLALRIGERAWTYDALNRSANRIARSILRRCGPESEPVALVAGRDGGAISAYLGILKAGKIAVVIDPSFPSEWAALIVADSQARHLLSAPEHVPYSRALVDREERIIPLDALDRDLGDDNPGLKMAPGATAQVLYTSGSTGRPKGIFFNHRRLLYDVMENVNAAHIGPADRLTCFGALTFGSGVKELFRGLLSGAAIFPYDIATTGLGKLADFLRAHAITIFKPSIAAFRYWVRDLSGSEEFPHIRLLILGGGPVTRADVAAYKQIFSPECLLQHQFSSTEAGLLCLYFIDKGSEIGGALVPAGYPVKDKEIFLVDERGARLGANGVGEIAVRSRYVSTGYWGEGEAGDGKFLGDPLDRDARVCLTGDLGRIEADGCVAHRGRKELQVKIRGFRVEPGEVETALSALSQVREAAVVSTADGRGETRLAAYVVPGTDSQLTPAALRHALCDMLPDYMIPQDFVLLDKLPLTANGKLDRRALPSAGAARPSLETACVAPATDLERRLAQIWAEALGLGVVGVHDNFLDLGGHSLSASRIIGKINQAFGVEVSMRSLLDHSTVAQMARVVAILCETGPAAASKSETDSAADQEIGEL